MHLIGQMKCSGNRPQMNTKAPVLPYIHLEIYNKRIYSINALKKLNYMIPHDLFSNI